MYTKLGDTIRVCFGTADATGAAQDADSLPVVTVLDQGSAMAYSPAVVKKATGLYEASIVASSGNGFVEGHSYSAFVTKVVGGITGRDGLASFLIRSDDATAVLSRLGTPAGASVSADIAATETGVNNLNNVIAAMDPKITTLHQIGVGRWKIQGTQLLIYEEDNTGLLLVFNLKDDAGQPSGTRIFERVPVP